MCACARARRARANEADRSLVSFSVHQFDLGPTATRLLPAKHAQVRVSERRRGVGQLLASFAAILGGVFTVMGIVDQAVYKGLGALKKGEGALAN